MVKQTRRRHRSSATQRSSVRRSANLRLARTVVLGTIAVALAIVWMGDQYGIERTETLQYMGAAAVFVGGLAALGLCAAWALQALRRLSRGREKND